jgi:hypothetical protein
LLEDIRTINSSTKTWTPLDYARSFATLGNKDYQTYLDFKEKYKLGHAILIAYLGGWGDYKSITTALRFREGKFKVSEIERAHVLCSQLKEMREYYLKTDNRPFAIAFRNIAMSVQYNHQNMMNKMKLYGKDIQDSLEPIEYMRQLEIVYNKGCETKDIVKLF